MCACMQHRRRESCESEPPGAAEPWTDLSCLGHFSFPPWVLLLLPDAWVMFLLPYALVERA